MFPLVYTVPIIQYMSQRSTKKNRAKRPRQRNAKSESRIEKGGVPRLLVNQSRHYMSDRYRTTLRFDVHGAVNNAGFVYTNVRYEPTYAYDIDPAGGSTAMPGFTELGGCYRRYRVVSFRYRIAYANQEAFPVVVWCCPVNNDPGSNMTAYQTLLSSRESRRKVLGPSTGNGIGTLVGQCSVSSFSGITNAGVDDNTSASVAGTAPINNIWLAIGGVGSVALVNGIYIDLQLEVTLDFYELQSPPT